MIHDMLTTKNIQMPEVVWDVIYLAACALHGKCPDKKRMAQMDFENVYRMSRFHSMEALVFLALEGEEVSGLAAPLAGEWKEAKEKVIRKNMLLDVGRRQIFGEMELAGIWYMPLKGSVLQALYPQYGMRQMADNDILYDAERCEDIRAMMERRGYVIRESGSSSHNVSFVKLPVYNFEMHTSLFERKENPGWYEYYQNVKDRLLQDENTQYAYHFTDEDFYVYMTAHAYVHYRHNGCGLRTLSDAYVYVWKKGTSLDWKYIEAQMSELGIADFERKLRLLSGKLFWEYDPCRKIDLSDEEWEMLLFFANSGTYGTPENYVARKMQMYGMDQKNLTFTLRLKYLWNRLFPNMEWFRENEPFYAKHKALIPFFLVWRMVRHLIFFRGWLGKELRILWKCR